MTIGIASLLACIGLRPAMAQVDPLGGLLDAVARTEAPGATQVGLAVRGSQRRGDFPVGLTASRCYVVSIVTTAPGRRVALVLWTPDGRQVAEAKPRLGSASLRHCASFSGPYRAQARIDGKGNYLASAYLLDATVPPVEGGMVSVFGPAESYLPPPLTPPPLTSAYPPPPLLPALPSRRGASDEEIERTVCTSSSDCGPDEFCKMTSEGDKVCMGNGKRRRGEGCKSSIECAYGLSCKDRGDDYLICK